MLYIRRLFLFHLSLGPFPLLFGGFNGKGLGRRLASSPRVALVGKSNERLQHPLRPAVAPANVDFGVAVFVDARLAHKERRKVFRLALRYPDLDRGGGRGSWHDYLKVVKQSYVLEAGASE